MTLSFISYSLLALGFEQFRSLPFYRRLIQKFMLPCKTEDQIMIRIKNLTSKNSPDNPMKVKCDCITINRV
jgi:hypothetical protein